MLGYTFAGTVTLGDFGTASYIGNLNFVPGDRANFSATSTSAASGLELNISSTVPFTWTTNDYISARFTYEAA